MTDRTPLAQEIASHLERGDFQSDEWSEILAVGAELLALARQKAAATGRQDFLDDIIHDFICDESAYEANQTDCPDEQEDVIRDGEREASKINNRGLAAQIAFILKDTDVEYGSALIKQIIQE